MTALYTDISPECCAVLEQRVADHDLPAGIVRCSDVRAVDAAMIAGFDQIHLFAGIGASPLGFAWAGWPENWSLITGGFPCQDISSAGKGAGLEGARSGLFWEMLRVIEIKKPMGVLAENVGALSARGLDRVAGALESVGYDVEALRVGAWAVGAPDNRERWWFVCWRRDESVGDEPMSRHTRPQQGEPRESGGRRRVSSNGSGRSDMGNIDGRRRQGSGVSVRPRRQEQAAGYAGGTRAGSQVADQSLRGLGAIGIGEAGSDANEPTAGVILDDSRSTRLERHRADAGQSQVAQPGHAIEPLRWPHPRWCVIDEQGIERTIPTPQHDWEPPRLFTPLGGPVTRTINARWRLALMGFPLHWLDLPWDRVGELAGPSRRKLECWWNKQGVVMTGNAQNPRVVEVLARAMVAAQRLVAA